MKKYTTLNIDLSSLISEGQAYINSLADSEGDEYRNLGFHWVGATSSLSSTFPSLSTVFSGLNITPVGIGHQTINKNAMFNQLAGSNLLIIPISDTENSSLHIFDLAPNANLLDGYYYDQLDCTLAESIRISTPLLLKESTVYTLETTGYTLADFFVITFNEDTSSLFN